jgi:hypothetical protein
MTKYPVTSKLREVQNFFNPMKVFQQGSVT